MELEDQKVKILEIKEVADFTKSYIIEKPENFEYKAGDHGYIELSPDNGKPFSFVSSPTEDFMEFATIIRDESKWKQELNSKQVGDSLILSGPYGKFGFENEEEIVLIAGGIGITPFIGILRYIRDKNLKTKVTLLYSNKSLSRTAFKEELDSMPDNIKTIYTMTEEDFEITGRIDKDFIEKYVDNFNVNFYVAGPPKMVVSINSILKELNVSKIKIDSFGGY